MRLNIKHWFLSKEGWIWHSTGRAGRTKWGCRKARQQRKKNSSFKYNWSLLNFNKPSKDRFLEMPRVLHLTWKYFTLSLEQRNRTPGREPEFAHFFSRHHRKEKREAKPFHIQPVERMRPTSQSPHWWQLWVWLMSPPMLLALLPSGLLHSFNFHPKSGSASSVKKAPKCYGGNRGEMQILVLLGWQEIWTVSTEMPPKAAEM